MSLINFKLGTPDDLASAPYSDGTVYFIFAQGSPQGHIYLDINEARKEISAAYNDSAILSRLSELERLTLVHSTGVSLVTNSIIISVGGSTTLTATAAPADVTDLIQWTNSDDSVCEIVSTTTNGNSSTIILSGIADGTSVITVTCGEYSAACLVESQSGMLVEHTLVENYTCDGSSFIYTAPIDLSHGQYIEVSLSVAGITQIKQNLISFGNEIDSSGTTTNGYRIHCYTSATQTKIQNTLRLFIQGAKASQSNIEFNIGNNNGDIVLKLDAVGLWLNGSLITPSATYQTLWNTILEQFRTNFTSFEVGSAEGTTRSTAHYNYIKYYAYEEE